MCSTNCFSNGVCDKYLGKCVCFEKHKGKYCQELIPYTIPRKQSIKITLLWGTTGELRQGVDQFLLDNSFNPVESGEIQFITKTIVAIKETKALNFRNKSEKTWIEEVQSNLTMEKDDAKRFYFSLSRESQMRRYLGTTSESDREKITWLAVEFHLNVSKHTPPFTMYTDHYWKWKQFVYKLNLRAPSTVGKVVMISDSWTAMDITIGIIISTIESFVTSNAICFISVLLFTGDIALSVLTMVAILLIVITLLGTLLGPVFNYTFGAIEAVGVTVFIGMSVDYALHIAHGYHSSQHKTRLEKVRATLTHLGVSILGGAITTGGSAVFLLFCKIYFFLQLGTMMLLNTTYALIYSLGWLCCMLILIGPTSKICYIYFYAKLPFAILMWIVKEFILF